MQPLVCLDKQDGEFISPPGSLNMGSGITQLQQQPHKSKVYHWQSKYVTWPELPAPSWISPGTVFEVISLSVCSLISKVLDDGRPMPRVSYFWEAIWFRLSQAQIWMSQSRSHQRAPFGFINSQRRSSLSIIAVIKMFWSCLAPTWNIFTEGKTSQVCLLASEKVKSSLSSVVHKLKYINTLQQSHRDWNQLV